MAFDILSVQPDAVESFVLAHEREAQKSFYGFSVIWHEQVHTFAARDGESIVGVAGIRIAASLAHVMRLIVAPEHRKRGVGRALLLAASDTANYYNCHKMSVMVPHKSGAQTFFERCGYKLEAVLPQHEFKADTAVLRKFLL
ncbi:MAG TPA: GNAT family N-acetyltransferase [Candidatus Baltobacteraceae bacterium]|nr:GNAT family N-acetyltransferase [Candidatus Baltobacteraceae bacterium]